MDLFLSSMKRRQMLASVTAATTAAATSAFWANKAEAAEVKRLAERGHDGIYARLPELALETKGDFYAGLSVWRGAELENAAEERAIEICKAAGYDDAKQKGLTWGEAVALISEDPLISMTCRARSSHQKLKYQMIQLYFHRNADKYIDEMEKADKLGPGTLELNPKMYIPEYTAHEIHSMPGGYVGDEFAGIMYDCGTNWGAYNDRNFQDESHMSMAATTVIPKDGKVKRILDIGTSIGQYAQSMKRRFPEAEVWGVDIGGPMVRYAHMKAADQGVAVNYAQRLAEDTKFPDGYFDVVTSNLVFHEVNYKGAQDIIKEVGRVLRPGGTFSPTDTNTNPVTAKGMYTLWYNYRWNHEDWYADWHRIDFKGEMEKNGLKVAPTNLRDFTAPKMAGTKA